MDSQKASLWLWARLLWAEVRFRSLKHLWQEKEERNLACRSFKATCAQHWQNHKMISLVQHTLCVCSIIDIFSVQSVDWISAAVCRRCMFITTYVHSQSSYETFFSADCKCCFHLSFVAGIITWFSLSPALNHCIIFPVSLLELT